MISSGPLGVSDTLLFLVGEGVPDLVFGIGLGSSRGSIHVEEGSVANTTASDFFVKRFIFVQFSSASCCGALKRKVFPHGGVIDLPSDKSIFLPIWSS